MITSRQNPTEPDWPQATAVHVDADTLTVDLDDGRTVAVPVQWYPRLAHGTPDERQQFEVTPFGLHWPVLDEDISIKGMLLGQKSGESDRSFERWLGHRERGETPWLEVRELPDDLKDHDLDTPNPSNPQKLVAG
jgi:hypothetical protein